MIGVVPAAGLGRRVAPLPCSKELYPVGFGPLEGREGPRPKPALHYQLDRFAEAGIRRAYVVLRRGKWDIPDYLGDGSLAGVDLAYLMMGHPYGVPYTVDQARPFVQGSRVALGLADILLWPEDVYARLAEELEETGSDVALGLFPAHKHWKSDMVSVSDSGRVETIQIKPGRTELRYTWLTAVWRASFTEYLHGYVNADLCSRDPSATDERELCMGDVLAGAIGDGLRVGSVSFEDGCYRDIGTPDDLHAAARSLLSGASEGGSP